MTGARPKGCTCQLEAGDSPCLIHDCAHGNAPADCEDCASPRPTAEVEATLPRGPEVAVETCRLLLTRGMSTLVDPVDYEWASGRRWHAGATGRLANRLFYAADSNGLRLHRLIGALMFGELTALDIDHVNGDKLDNRRANLRTATRQQNCWNSPPRTGRFKGVHRDSRNPTRCIAQLRDPSTRNVIHLGTFNTEEEAARAYDAAALRLYGEFAWLNFR